MSSSSSSPRRSASSPRGCSAASLKMSHSGQSWLPRQTYRLDPQLSLTVAQGSVVDFQGGAIVNAANEECLGGGGVDGAITNAGGPQLAEDRYDLQQVRPGIRCPTGNAKLTGPGRYGTLQVPYVIHAVGPNYLMFDEETDDVKTPHRLLRSAYQRSLDCTLGQPIETVAFSLLSAGVYRGRQGLATVLGIGVKAIQDWSRNETKRKDSVLTDVVLFGFNDREAQTLVRVCDYILGEDARIGPPEEATSNDDVATDDHKQESDKAMEDDKTTASKEDTKPEAEGKKNHKGTDEGAGESEDSAEGAKNDVPLKSAIDNATVETTEEGEKQEENKKQKTEASNGSPLKIVATESEKPDQEMTDKEGNECESPGTEEETELQQHSDGDKTDTSEGKAQETDVPNKEKS